MPIYPINPGHTETLKRYVLVLRDLVRDESTELEPLSDRGVSEIVACAETHGLTVRDTVVKLLEMAWLPTTGPRRFLRLRSRRLLTRDTTSAAQPEV